MVVFGSENCRQRLPFFLSTVSDEGTEYVFGKVPLDLSHVYL